MFGFFKRKKSKEHNKKEAQDTTVLPNDNEINAIDPATEVVEEVAKTVASVDAANEIAQVANSNVSAIESVVQQPIQSAINTADETNEDIQQVAEELKVAAAEMAAQAVALDETNAVSRETQAIEEVIEEPITTIEAEPVLNVPETQAQTQATADTVVDSIADAPEDKAVPTPVVAVAESIDSKPAKLGWAARLKQGLSKSRTQLAKSLAGVFGGGKIDEDLYEELEAVLLTSDMGLEATEHLLKEVRDRVSLRGLKNGDELRGALKEAVLELITPLEKPLTLPEGKGPFVIMMAGVNGAGKTTSIGKLAKYFQSQGKSVLLAAGDTFRAAAREQLIEWGDRNNVTVISQASGDSAAVCFDAMEAAKARGIDVVLADTAGRLPTQLHLMEEIKKVKRVIQKALPDAPQEIILVLDANIGQNALNQVAAFDDALGLTGLILSKLDGTAKGGVIAALAKNRPVPVRFIGVGEGIDDLRPFIAKDYVDALLDDNEQH